MNPKDRILDPEAKLQHVNLIFKVRAVPVLEYPTEFGTLEKPNIEAVAVGSMCDLSWPLGFSGFGPGGDGSTRPSAHAGRPTISQDAHTALGVTQTPEGKCSAVSGGECDLSMLGGA